MNGKQFLAAVLALVLILLCCGCGRAEETKPPETAAPETVTAPMETEQKTFYQHIRSSDNGDGTFTIGIGDVLVKIVPPEGMESKGGNAESVILGREDDFHFIQFAVVEAVDDPALSGASLQKLLDDTCVRADENRIPYQRRTEQISTDFFDFTCDLLVLQPENQPPRAAMLAWAPITQIGDQSYYIKLQNISGDLSVHEEDFNMEELPLYLEAVCPES